MCKKFLAMVLAMAMLVFCIPMSVSANASGFYDRLIEAYKTAVEKNEVVESTEVEGITISCKYVKSTQEYFLYMEDEEYKLDVSFDDGKVWFDIVDETEMKADTVCGQNPVLLGLGLLAPEVITAIEGCLIGVASAAGVVGVAYVSTELINEISGSTAMATINASVADVAVATMTSGVSVRTEYDNSYFEAALAGDGTVFIGQLLTYKDAIIRLKGGYDIMAIDSSKAYALATVASPVKRAIWHSAHPGPGMRYDHWHPVGIRWSIDTRYKPHVWYL